MRTDATRADVRAAGMRQAIGKRCDILFLDCKLREAGTRVSGSGIRTANYGFLTVVGDDDEGFVGGLLVLDLRGRPIEFHCTAPLRPNRAQSILYGPTLRQYIVAEQIARVLFANVKSSLHLVWIDDGDALGLREAISTPMALVNANSAGDFTGHEVDFTVHPGFPQDRERVACDWRNAAHWINCQEPFQRIREAIGEAHRAQARTA